MSQFFTSTDPNELNVNTKEYEILNGVQTGFRTEEFWGRQVTLTIVNPSAELRIKWYKEAKAEEAPTYSRPWSPTLTDFIKKMQNAKTKAGVDVVKKPDVDTSTRIFGAERKSKTTTTTSTSFPQNIQDRHRRPTQAHGVSRVAAEAAAAAVDEEDDGWGPSDESDEDLTAEEMGWAQHGSGIQNDWDLRQIHEACREAIWRDEQSIMPPAAIKKGNNEPGAGTSGSSAPPAPGYMEGGWRKVHISIGPQGSPKMPAVQKGEDPNENVLPYEDDEHSDMEDDEDFYLERGSGPHWQPYPCEVEQEPKVKVPKKSTSDLPAGCRLVTIGDRKFYVLPPNQIDPNEMMYRNILARI